MSQGVEEAFVLNTSNLQPKDWQSGDRIWFIDWIAPFGGTREMTRDLKENVFPNDVGRFLRMKEGKRKGGKFGRREKLTSKQVEELRAAHRAGSAPEAYKAF